MQDKWGVSSEVLMFETAQIAVSKNIRKVTTAACSKNAKLRRDSSVGNYISRCRTQRRLRLSMFQKD